MYAGGYTQLPAYVLPAVLPLVVDLDRAKLSRGDRKLLVLLRANAGAAAGSRLKTLDVLYNRLPASVRPEVSPVDFADFVDRLVAACEAATIQASMTSFCATSRAGFGSVSHRDPQRRVSRPLPSAAAVSLAIARATTRCLTYCEKQN